MSVTVTVPQLREALGGRAASLPDSDVVRLLGMVTALVDAYAEDAPEAVANEATLRAGAWWFHSPQFPLEKETVGPKSGDYALNRLNPLHHSGASSILSYWHTQSVGVIE